jgi:hypothetical protein
MVICKKSYKEDDMELNEPNIRTGHPPHSRAEKKNNSLPLRIPLKVSLFVIVFILSFYFPHCIPGPNTREETIQEILSVLERHRTGLASVTKEELAKVIYEEAIRYNHDPKFIMALISAESEFWNWAVSEKGAKGLMQIMPYVAESIAKDLRIEWKGERTLFDPYLNIRMGVYYLNQLTLNFKDMRVALAAYNYGPTYVKGLIDKKQQIPIDYHYYYRRVITAYQNL